MLYVCLNEHAQSNSFWRFPFIPIFKFHSRVLRLESLAKVEGVPKGMEREPGGLQCGCAGHA